VNGYSVPLVESCIVWFSVSHTITRKVKRADNLVHIKEKRDRESQKSFRLSFDEEDSFEDFRINGRVILKWILKN